MMTGVTKGEGCEAVHVNYRINTSHVSKERNNVRDFNKTHCKQSIHRDYCVYNTFDELFDANKPDEIDENGGNMFAFGIGSEEQGPIISSILFSTYQ